MNQREPTGAMTSDVLVFGDEPAHAGRLLDAVRRAGLRPRVLGDKAGMARVLARGDAKVVMIDLALTGAEGHALIREIRASPSQRYLGIVAMGGAEALGKLGFDVDWKLPKPVDLAQVPNVLRSVASIADGRRR